MEPFITCLTCGRVAPLPPYQEKTAETCKCVEAHLSIDGKTRISREEALREAMLTERRTRARN